MVKMFICGNRRLQPVVDAVLIIDVHAAERCESVHRDVEITAKITAELADFRHTGIVKDKRLEVSVRNPKGWEAETIQDQSSQRRKVLARATHSHFCRKFDLKGLIRA